MWNLNLLVIYCGGASKIHAKNRVQFIVGVAAGRKTKIDEID